MGSKEAAEVWMSGLNPSAIQRSIYIYITTGLNAVRQEHFHRKIDAVCCVKKYSHGTAL
jgi:hypothetical protein